MHFELVDRLFLIRGYMQCGPSGVSVEIQRPLSMFKVVFAFHSYIRSTGGASNSLAYESSHSTLFGGAANLNLITVFGGSMKSEPLTVDLHYSHGSHFGYKTYQ